MRVFRKIRVQLTAIVLICYLLPVTVLGLFVGGAVLGDFKVKTESALTTGMSAHLACPGAVSTLKPFSSSEFTT